MKISSSDFGKAVEKWAENYLVNKGTLLQQGVTTFLILQMKPKAEVLFSKFAFLADEQGMFELEILHKNLITALDKMGGRYTVPLIDYVFDSADIDKIIECAKEYATC